MLNALHTQNSPFSELQLNLLKQGFNALDTTQAQWLSGYLAGLLAGSGESLIAPPAPVIAEGEELTILFGSETGNGESIATALAAKLQQEGIATRLESMDGFRPVGLKKLKHAVFVISTHGEGDVPDEALDVLEFLESDRAPKLDGLKYRVLALGDRSYTFFCAAGVKLDERLQALGATRFGDRIDCDVDYDADAALWSAEVLGFAKSELKANDLSANAQTATGAHLSIVPKQPRWTRQQPYNAEVLRLQKITGNDSEKDVYHLELSLEDSGLEYQAGDALGIWAPNDAALVDEILAGLKIDTTTSVKIDDTHFNVQEAVLEHREITKLTADTVTEYAGNGQQEILLKHFESLSADQQRDFIEQRQFADLVAEYPTQLEAQALIDLLRPLGPRSYSIASSQTLVDEEVHLTVATHFSDAIGVQRQGVASQFLNHRIGEGGKVRVFAEPNHRFHLPENPETPIIMIAAGTGVAPFRAFMQELETRGSTPDSWLIFGNPHLRSDFLYQKEWLQWRESGLLKHIDTAFSRDQADKVYVQHVVTQQSERVAAWLERGASIYICGALSMGQAVQDALQDAIASQQGLDNDAAVAAMADLRRNKRIHKDLY